VEDKQTFSRVSTARALVLLAAGLATGGALLLCLLTVVFVTKIAFPTAVFAGFTLISAVASTLLTIRARSLGRVVGLGCGMLLTGVLIGLVVMLLLASRVVGDPA
jgi:hypothetical protein